MKNIIAALVFALLLFGCAAQTAPETGEETVPGPAEEVPEETIEAPEPVEISAEELSLHSTVFDCWLVYGGDVYDVTFYLGNHPGGAETITPYCGLADDSFANAFEGQHGTFKVSVLEEEGILKGVLAHE